MLDAPNGASLACMLQALAEAFSAKLSIRSQPNRLHKTSCSCFDIGGTDNGAFDNSFLREDNTAIADCLCVAHGFGPWELESGKL